MLQPNFRASTGYGKKFLNAGNSQWGDKMQDDITWGVKYLVAQGIADPKRVGIMGGSYGGYATLAGVAFTPDLYAAAVAIVGAVEPDHAARLDPAVLGSRSQDLLHADGRPGNAGRQEAARTAVAAQLGRQDQDAAAGGAGRQRSAREQAPSRIRSSSRCATAASRSSTSSRPTRATASRGRSTTWRCSRRPRSSWPSSSHGRYQETATPDVATRLKEITVDPKTVTLLTNKAP